MSHINIMSAIANIEEDELYSTCSGSK